MKYQVRKKIQWVERHAKMNDIGLWKIRFEKQRITPKIISLLWEKILKLVEKKLIVKWSENISHRHEVDYEE